MRYGGDADCRQIVSTSEPTVGYMVDSRGMADGIGGVGYSHVGTGQAKEIPMLFHWQLAGESAGDVG